MVRVVGVVEGHLINYRYGQRMREHRGFVGYVCNKEPVDAGGW